MMLDFNKIVKELQVLVPRFNTTFESDYKIAYNIWNRVVSTISIQEKIQDAFSRWVVPKWVDLLGSKKFYGDVVKYYCALSVDGSQIYYNRHQAISCYLLNMGIVQIVYDYKESSAYLKSVPSVYTLGNGLDSADFAEDSINCKRTEQELSVGFEQSLIIKKNHPKLPLAFLCDGSLIFWHLEHKSPSLKAQYLVSYIRILEKFYHAQIPILGYISMPKSKELVNIVRKAVDINIIDILDSENNIIKNDNTLLESLVDTDIVSHILKKYEGTSIFINQSSIVEHYPDHLKPCFIYLSLEQEIIRLEFPFWLTLDPNLFSQSINIVVDQVVKGNGYPIVLSEAHEQAVVKSADRELFYHMLNTLTHTCRKSNIISQKSQKKRIVPI